MNHRRIIQLTVENFKRLKAVSVTPKGNLVVIGGKNGQGKTSLLDAIASLLSGREIPGVPIRRGEMKSMIVADLGDLVLRRTITASGNTLSVETKEGAVYKSPQAVLDKFTGKVTFDPLSFIDLPAKDQAAALKKMVGLDFTALDYRRRMAYDERALVNKHVADAEVRYRDLPHFQDAPAEETSLGDVLAEIDSAQEYNRTISNLDKGITGAADEIAALDRQNAGRIDEIASLRKRIAQLESEHETTGAAINEKKLVHDELIVKRASSQPRDIGALKAKASGVETVNRQVRANTVRDDAARALQKHREKAQALTSQIDEIDRQKGEQLAAAKFPITGLSFDETGVTFDGLPFVQASTAQQLRISVAIAIALNPELKVMLVKSGNDLDEDNLALLAEEAERHDLQIWLERVGKGQECGVIIEDGEAVLGGDVIEEVAEVQAGNDIANG